MEEMMGAAPLWIDSTLTGEAAVRSGSNARPRNPFMMADGFDDGREKKEWKEKKFKR